MSGGGKGVAEMRRLTGKDACATEVGHPKTARPAKVQPELTLPVLKELDLLN
jgi:hypothetical protein